MTRLLDLYRHRALIGVLTSRELKARYRGSVLGYFWSLLNPLLMLAVYALVFEVLLPNRSPGTSPYALFLFTGLLPWNWLASSLTDAASSLLVSGALLKKVLFPAEVLPVVAVASQAVHFLLALPILLAGLLAGALGLFGPAVPLGWPLLQVPVLFVLQGLFLLGIGLFLAALMMIKRYPAGSWPRKCLGIGVWTCALCLTLGMIFEWAGVWGLPLWGSMLLWTAVLCALKLKHS